MRFAVQSHVHVHRWQRTHLKLRQKWTLEIPRELARLKYLWAKYPVGTPHSRTSRCAMDGWGKVRRRRVDVHADRSRVAVAGARERERESGRTRRPSGDRKQRGDPIILSAAQQKLGRAAAARARASCTQHVPLALLWLCKRAPRNFVKSGHSNFRLNARGLGDLREACT